jgi:hypothetical protein
MPCSRDAKHTLTFGKDTHSDHRDYVPDRKTAERIAEAVLEAQFGEEQIKTQGPLLVDESNKDFWIMQVSRGKKGDAHARRRTCGMDQ